MAGSCRRHRGRAFAALRLEEREEISRGISAGRSIRQRGWALGTYRYWRDTGYAIGSLLLGAVANWGGGILPAIWGTAALVALSGLWIALAVTESRPRAKGPAE